MGRIGIEAYRSKVYGCWLGKSIGGTLGGPHEGKDGPLSLTFYDPVPTEPQFNDDLDLQLVWLHALEERGLEVTPAELSAEWLDHIAYPWCEYGFSQLNARRGLIPPLTGSYDNWFGDCMGAPIRSEIWACIAPGCPHIACEYAWRDAIRDHWGEGVWGEMFFAAVESAAFVISDRDALLDIGLSAVPPWSQVARAVAQVRDSYARGYDWLTARNRVLAEFGQQHMTNAPQNIAFTVLGWLYGEDFGDALLKAVNCGRDTDCTGATLGSILGIILGQEGIPREWREPIAEGIKVGWGIVNMDVPQGLDELTERTIRIGQRVIAHMPEVMTISEGSEVWADPDALTRLASKAMFIWDRRPDEIWLKRDASVRLWYMGPPTVAAGGTKRLMVIGASGVGVRAPEGWTVNARKVDDFFEISLRAPSDMPAHAIIELTAEGAKHPIALIRKPEWEVARIGAVEPPAEPPSIADWTPWLSDGYQMDFTSLLGASAGTVVARTNVVVPRDTQATLLVVTPHRARAWLNGAQVITKDTVLPNDRPPYNVSQDAQAAVTLTAGANELVVAITSSGGPCMARIYFIDGAQHGLPEAAYVLRP
ncbi:MAG: ADP-ribosylglycohydrolase family protein [Armatimonadetes bacterium]|nr:ADP-ribosylglycohydrolase family protein [Armatimonadota bacterium]